MDLDHASAEGWTQAVKLVNLGAAGKWTHREVQIYQRLVIVRAGIAVAESSKKKQGELEAAILEQFLEALNNPDIVPRFQGTGSPRGTLHLEPTSPAGF